MEVELKEIEPKSEEAKNLYKELSDLVKVRKSFFKKTVKTLMLLQYEKSKDCLIETCGIHCVCLSSIFHLHGEL